MAIKLAYCVLGVAFIVVLVPFPAVDAGLTEEEKQEIVNAHNYYRGMVDPIATNMEMMVRSELFFFLLKVILN